MAEVKLELKIKASTKEQAFILAEELQEEDELEQWETIYIPDGLGGKSPFVTEVRNVNDMDDAIDRESDYEKVF